MSKGLPLQYAGRRKVSFNKYIITNNGELEFTYAEARELGIKSDRTFYRILRELATDLGFIDITEPGNWYEKKPTKFAHSNRYKDYGTPNYKRLEIPRRLPKSLGFKNKTRCHP